MPALMEMKVEVITRETIKPSSLTPHHLTNFKLSLLDQFAPPTYTPLVLFYKTSYFGDHKAKHIVSQRLKKSLSEILTLFYPLAGRIKDHLSVDCNDDGADFLEARVNCSISCILEQPKLEVLKHFVPTEFIVSGNEPLLLVQASFFECGGMALGMFISHKVADAATFSTFLKEWARTAFGNPHSMGPDFYAASFFPPRDHIPTLAPPASSITQTVPQNGIARRYVFEAFKLNALKAKVARSSSMMEQQPPTRVEAVSALIWKCAMDASRSRSRSRLGSPRPSVLDMLVNIRSRTVPPLSENSFGNGIVSLVAHEDSKCEIIDLPGLVCRIREGNLELRNTCANHPSEIYNCLMDVKNLMLKANEVDFYILSSWCRFPFYEADFGWGKPTWASVGYQEFPNVVVLSDTRDGEGIEAWVNLIEEDMALFECNQELLAFATLNPPIS